MFQEQGNGDFPDGTVVETSTSKEEEAVSNPGLTAKIPQASWLKNIKQKQ